MPKEGLSVYFSGVDKMSPVLNSITDKTKALDKANEELQQTYNALQKANQTIIAQRTEIKNSLEAQSVKVSKLRTEYKKCSNEINEQNLNRAIEEQDALKDKLKEVEDQLKANRKTFKENREEIRKGLMEDQGSSQGTGLNDIAKGLFAGQIGQMFSTSLGGAFETGLTSMVGTPQASLVSDMLSNAISGAAAGTLLPIPGGPAIGAIIGAGAGALSGLISGNTKIFEAKDDAFKDYYGGLYEDVSGRSGAMVESGSAIAGGREQTRMAFAQRLGGDDEARAYLAQVEKMAASTNYEYDEIVGYAKLLLNSYAPDEVFNVLGRLSDATAGLNLDASDVNVMISGLSRMRTTGKATQEYLNYFRERGVDVDQALADDLGVEKSAVSGMVTKGEIGGEDAAQAILDFLESEFGGLSDTLAGTYDAMVDNLGDINASLEAAGGDAYNAMRKEGIQAEMDAYGGELGDAIKEINAVMGENQARRENLQDQYAREVLDAVLNGNRGELWSGLNEKQQSDLTKMHEEYVTALERYEASGRTDMEAGAELAKLYETAQTMGQSYFDNSAEIQRLNEIEIDEITLIRENTAGVLGAVENIYAKTQEMSKGLASLPAIVSSGGRTAPTPDEAADAENALAAWRADPDSVSPGAVSAAQNTLADNMAAARRNAFGLARVPYDEYPALLHEGERVLTAAEARAQDAGGGQPVSITITGNSFTGMPEEMADQLAQIILQRLTEASIAAAPK